MNHLLRFSLALWVGVVSHAAQAVTALPDAYGSLNFNLSQTVFTFPAGATYGCGAVSITALPAPSVSATGTNCPRVPQAIFIYSFSVMGPANLVVPVSIRAAGTLNADGAAQAAYSLTVQNETLVNASCYFGSPQSCGPKQFSFSRSFTANQIYGVNMMALESNFLGSGSGTAFLDPYFAIDPAFPNAADYAIVFSAGVGNSASLVPEPSMLAMWVLGMCLLASKPRRKTRAA